MFKEPTPEDFGYSTLKIDEYGNKFWYLNEKFHREDGPAIEWFNGTKEWYLNNRLHRENYLPSLEFANGYKEWYLNDKLHRVNGPAVEHYDGSKYWYLNGRYYSEEDFAEKVKDYV